MILSKHCKELIATWQGLQQKYWPGREKGGSQGLLRARKPTSPIQQLDKGVAFKRPLK